MKVLTFIAKNAAGKKRRGLWVFHSDGRGNFFHGDRDEIQEARWTLKELLDGKYAPVSEVNATEALALLSGWDEGEGAQTLKRIIEREGHTEPEQVT